MSGRPTAVITGASAGLGRATAIAFARAGYDVALIARGAERLESARREAERQGVRALAFQADVADAPAVFAAADAIAQAFGKIDLWINLAMATVMAPVHRIAPDEYDRVTRVTYLGQVHGTLAALRHMRPRNSGAILQVGSALAYRAIPLQSAYCAAKFAVRGFTDSLRTELIHEGSAIRLTMAQLPAVNTPQFDWARSRMPRRLQPVPPIFQPEDVAAALVDAAEKAPREVWIGWPAVRAIVGNFIAPGLLDHLAANGAWDQQMTDEPADPGRPDNLFEPPPGDPGAHGRFDGRTIGPPQAISAGAARAGALALAALACAGAVWLGRATAPAGRRRRGPRIELQS